MQFQKKLKNDLHRLETELEQRSLKVGTSGNDTKDIVQFVAFSCDIHFPAPPLSCGEKPVASS